MNSRIENGEMSLRSKEEVLNQVYTWLDEDESIEEILEETDAYVSYFVDDFERSIYFPEKDSVDRIKKAMCYDEKVKAFVDPDKVADFIYNCIDVNALACVEHIALLWDKPAFDKDGNIEGWEETEGRKQLMENVGDDEYALCVGVEALGMNWVERSVVIINISELVKSSEEIAEIYASDYYTNMESEFPMVFEEALVQTICHEFRHSIYDMNEFTPLGSEEYPYDGGLEENVEDYGNDEAYALMRNEKATPYIESMFQFDRELRREYEQARDERSPKVEIDI